MRARSASWFWARDDQPSRFSRLTYLGSTGSTAAACRVPREQQDGADAHAVATVIRLAATGDPARPSAPHRAPGILAGSSGSRESDTSRPQSSPSTRAVDYYGGANLTAALPVIGARTRRPHHPAPPYALDPCCRSYSEMICRLRRCRAPRVRRLACCHLDTMTADPGGVYWFVESALDFPLPPPG